MGAGRRSRAPGSPEVQERCQACGCPIEFIRGPKGALIPVQKVRTVYQLVGRDLVKHDAIGSLFGDLYVSHFETCSDPNRFSTKRERG